MDFQVVIDSLTQIWTDLVGFIPRLVNGLIILIVGYAIAWTLRWLIGAILRRLQVDPLVEQTGMTGSLRSIGIQTPLSQILAQTVFAFLLISFLITSTRLMGLEAVAVMLERLLNFLPNAVAGVIVFLLGGIVARFVGDLLTAAGQGAGLDYAAQLGRVVQGVITIFTIVLALGVLGIDTALLVTALTIGLAAIGLALGLALGLGSRPIIFQILAGYYMRQRLPSGQPVAFAQGEQQVQGEVSGVGSVNTTVATERETLVIPNTVLFESLVRLGNQPPTPATPPPPDSPAQ